MSEEKRRIQMTGGSTLIVSLPIAWAREMGVSQGDEVVLTQKRDKSILISPQSKANKEISKATIQLIPNEPPENIVRLLISHYLVGYDVITLASQKGFSAKDRKWIKDTIRLSLIGMEVVEESGDRLILQSLLNYTELTLPNAIQRMSKIIRSMQKDVISAIREGNQDYAKDVIQRDSEVDRFYLLTVRQIKSAIRDVELTKKIGIYRQRDCIGYRLIVKSLERIADHAERIAENILQIKGIKEISKTFPEICELGDLSRKVFDLSIECLSEMDRKLANLTISEAKEAVKMEGVIVKKVLNSEFDIVEKTYIRSALESFGRIAEYGADIAEVIINMSVKGPEEED